MPLLNPSYSGAVRALLSVRPNTQTLDLMALKVLGAERLIG
jgi:hypothetical protein